MWTPGKKVDKPAHIFTQSDIDEIKTFSHLIQDEGLEIEINIWDGHSWQPNVDRTSTEIKINIIGANDFQLLMEYDFFQEYIDRIKGMELKIKIPTNQPRDERVLILTKKNFISRWDQFNWGDTY